MQIPACGAGAGGGTAARDDGAGCAGLCVGAGIVCVLTRTFKSTPLGFHFRARNLRKKTLKESVLEKLP